MSTVPSSNFFATWADAALTTLGFFWMAFWAFCLGYVISSAIQVFVSEERMRRTMGESGPSAVALGTFFGFISSSCSFAALSTSRALFQKGAGLVPALAFLLASTNLVIELGILIYIFLSWQFVVAEYVGGLMLVLLMWGLVRLTLSESLEQDARSHAEAAGGADDGEIPDWHALVRSLEGWRLVAHRYFMEWGMVWKDVTFGFTVAGIIAAFVPPEFFQSLFVGSSSGSPAWWQIVLHTLIGPLAAFFTFIGSMGNIPLAAILFGSGVSFAGVMAFIFSDLVVFPVLRITSQYFGWRMAAYIMGIFLACLVTTSLLLHWGFAALDLLPETSSTRTNQVDPSERFAVDYTLILNFAFLAVSAGFATLLRGADRGDDSPEKSSGGEDGDTSWMERLLTFLALASVVWLVVGVALWVFGV